MRALVIAVGLALAAALAAAAWVRTIDVPPARAHETRGPDAVGDHSSAGGFVAVRAVEDPAAALAALDRVARDSPRTRPLAGSAGQGHASYVTRSRVFGFPDVTNVWIDGGRVHVAAHLIVGGSDFGVNRRRVEAWLARAGIA